MYPEFLMNFYKNLRVDLTDEYLSSSTTLALIIGAIGMVMIIVSAFLVKRNRVLGVFAGLLQVAFSYCSQKLAHFMHTTDFFRVETIYGDNQEDLENKLDEFYSNFYEELISTSIVSVLYSVFIMASFVLTLVFVIKCLKLKPNGLFKAVLILNIVKMVLLAPYDMITPFVEKLTVESVASYDIIYYAATLLPLILLVIGAIVVKTKKNPPVQTEQTEQPDLADISAAG